MWNLAYRLAHCGEHRNYQAIEWELQAYGYPQARQLLYDARVRARLDATLAPRWTTNSTLHATKRMVASFAIASANPD
jgi:hypothetical protein